MGNTTKAFTVLVIVAATGCNGDTKAAADSTGGGTPAASSAPTATTTQTVSMTAEAVRHGGVTWQAATQRLIAGSIEVPGQLVPNEDRTARLGAPAQARVVAVPVQVGDRVTQGQALVTLQSSEASTARADHNKALAELNARRAAATYARAAKERAERLLAAKAIPRQDVERATADDELATAEVASAEAEVARTATILQQLGVGPDGGMAARSPIDGVVISRDAVPGVVVQAGAPLVVVTDPASLWLDAAVSDRAASSLRTGGRVRFTVPAFPVDTFSARIVSVGSALDAASRTLPVRALIENAGLRLRAQMFATVWVEGGEMRQAVAVPESAMMLLDQRPVVFVARPGDGGSAVFERRDVVIGGTSGGMVQILDGVKPGELVVVNGSFAVKALFSRAKMAGG